MRGTRWPGACWREWFKELAYEKYLEKEDRKVKDIGFTK